MQSRRGSRCRRKFEGGVVDLPPSGVGTDARRTPACTSVHRGDPAGSAVCRQQLVDNYIQTLFRGSKTRRLPRQSCEPPRQAKTRLENSERA